MTPRLKELYFKKIQTSLKEKFAFKNVYMSPQLQKVVINMGLGLDGNDSKIVKSCQEDLAKIAGQKPVITKFKKSISNFKTRKNNRAKVKGINLVKKHIKTTKEKKGGIFSQEDFLNMSNLLIVDNEKKIKKPEAKK